MVLTVVLPSGPVEYAPDVLPDVTVADEPVDPIEEEYDGTVVPVDPIEEEYDGTVVPVDDEYVELDGTVAPVDEEYVELVVAVVPVVPFVLACTEAFFWLMNSEAFAVYS